MLSAHLVCRGSRTCKDGVYIQCSQAVETSLQRDALLVLRWSCHRNQAPIVCHSTNRNSYRSSELHRRRGSTEFWQPVVKSGTTRTTCQASSWIRVTMQTTNLCNNSCICPSQLLRSTLLSHLRRKRQSFQHECQMSRTVDGAGHPAEVLPEGVQNSYPTWNLYFGPAARPSTGQPRLFPSLERHHDNVGLSASWVKRKV